MAGTLVATADGEKPIEEIKVGDQVYATDPETGESGLFTVTDTFSHTAEAVMEIEIGTDRIRATPEHPFWVEGHGWTKAGDLHPGDCVASLEGKCRPVRSLRRIEGHVTVYWRDYGTRKSGRQRNWCQMVSSLDARSI